MSAEAERIARELAQRLAPVCESCGEAHPQYASLMHYQRQRPSNTTLRPEICNSCWNDVVEHLRE